MNMFQLDGLGSEIDQTDVGRFLFEIPVLFEQRLDAGENRLEGLDAGSVTQPQGSQDHHFAPRREVLDTGLRQ